MKTIIVLAMHGMTPKDFPAAEKAEFFRLRSRVGEPPFKEPKTPDQKRVEELDAKMRAWPRTEANDPFAAASCSLAGALKDKSGLDVLVGFNEFCSPDLNEAFDLAVAQGAGQVIVVTPMVTRGGNHSEEEIPELVEEAKKRHSNVRFIYAWPYQDQGIADFLNKHIQSFLPEVSSKSS